MTKDEAFESIIKLGKSNTDVVIKFLEFAEKTYLDGIYQKQGEDILKQIGAASGCAGLVNNLKSYIEQKERNREESKNGDV